MENIKRGVTLIELVLAFLILVICTLSVSSLISFGHRGTKKDFRNVVAIQLLEDRMNQVLALPEKSLYAAIGGTSQTFSSGNLLGVPVGATTTPAIAPFNVSITLEKVNVDFWYRPLDLVNSPNYDPDPTAGPPTWVFSGLTKYDCDGKVVKITTTVSWTEPVSNANRVVEVVSFAVDLEV
ncbi:hypothetical protein HYY75_00245 [bacterium]|nr:hypothetical protein [bacterium]